MEVVFIAAVIYLFLFAFLRPSGGGDGRRLTRMEYKLDVILKHLGLEEELTVQVPALVEEEIRAGRKIQAIKALRDSNPWLGLKEAKDYVEDLIRRGADQPAV